MKKRPAWGHVSRHCIYCGKVGPRTQVLGGYAHKRCLPAKQLQKVTRPDPEAQRIEQSIRERYRQTIRDHLRDMVRSGPC